MRSVLICAGLDPSGGAGLLADASIATQLDVRPVGVVTTLTVQDTLGVRSHQPVDAELVRDQLDALLSDVEVHAVKIGMLGSAAIADALGKSLALTQAPVVWDPVLHPTRGRVWNGRESFTDVVAALAGQVTVLTPNAQELAAIAEREITSIADAIDFAHLLSARHGGMAVLVKGGHYRTDALDAIDVLVEPAGATRLTGPRVPHGEDVHGTGCALSTAIAAELAKGASLVDACRAAKHLVYTRIANPVRPGRGAPAVV